MSKETQDSFVLDDFDDFTLAPGADSVATPAGTGDEKPSIFTTKTQDLSFMDDIDNDEEEEEEEKAPVKATASPAAGPAKSKDKEESAEDLFKEFDKEDEEEDYEDEESKTSSKSRVGKNSAPSEIFNKLIEDEILFGFDDDKPMEDYSLKDWKELIELNIAEREAAVRRETPKQFFDSLPDELKYAAKYVSEGGTDMKGLFKALSYVEETRELDPKKDAHTIARTYLGAKGLYDSEEELENQINEWEDLGILEKKASQFKPKLEKLQEEVVAQQIERQERVKHQQEETAHLYMNNVYETLKPGELNGVRIDKKTQQFLFQELTSAKYQSMTGKPTNLLGHLLESYQFSDKPRYDLIAEATWLLADPEGYKEELKKTVKNEVTASTVRTLKTEQSRRVASHVPEEREEVPVSRSSRKIARPTNIFKR
jgi:hypothetical protein